MHLPGGAHRDRQSATCQSPMSRSSSEVGATKTRAAEHDNAMPQEVSAWEAERSCVFMLIVEERGQVFWMRLPPSQ